MVLVFLIGAGQLLAQSKIEPPSQFVRLSKSQDGDLRSLDTAIVDYVGKAASGRPVRVALIAAVHIGEAAYFDKLNEEFLQYDSLLYELVAPPGVNPNLRQKSASHPVSALQLKMKELLELEFQLDAINYSAPNFVHADMSPQEFDVSMERRGESLTETLMKAVGGAFLHQIDSEPTPPDLRSMFFLMFPQSRAIALRRMLAKGFEQMDQVLAMINGQEGSTLLTVRNSVALGVLRRQLDLGKQSIGIFYGGAHMPDFEQHLITEFGLKPSSQRWITAWTLSK